MDLYSEYSQSIGSEFLQQLDTNIRLIFKVRISKVNMRWLSGSIGFSRAFKLVCLQNEMYSLGVKYSDLSRTELKEFDNKIIDLIKEL